MNNFIVTSKQRNGSCLCICEIQDNKCKAHGTFKNGANRGGNIKLNHLYEKLYITDFDYSQGEGIEKSVVFHNAYIYAMKSNTRFKNGEPMNGEVKIYLTAENSEEVTI